MRSSAILNGLKKHASTITASIVAAMPIGLDHEVWNPATDQAIARNYDASSIENKVENKLALQRENNLPQDPQAPLIGIVSRLSPQKEPGMIADALDEIVSLGTQIVLLGTGDEHYQDMFRG